MPVFDVNAVNPENLREYIKVHSKGDVSRTLTVLANAAHFMEAWNTEIGYEILKDACVLHNEALTKIAGFDATDEDRARYSVLDTLIKKWASRIATYEELARKVNA